MSVKELAFNLIDKFYLKFLGPFFFAAVIAAPLSVYFLEDVSKGYKLIWITLAIIGVSIYFQLKKLNPFFKSKSIIEYFTKNSTAVRWYFFFINFVGSAIFIYLLVNYYNSYHNPTEPRVAFYGHPIIAAIYYTIISFVFGACAIGVLYSFLFMGAISNGVSLAITFHNWANGMGLDYQIFIQYFFDLTLPDILALFINLIWLAISYNLSKGVDVQVG